MRPRVFPAEDIEYAAETYEEAEGFNEAAGIPRGRRRSRQAGRLPARCFNEAAGIPRGRRLLGSVERLRQRASMRPRVFPAEDVADLTKLPRYIALQ